jgi:hypothetical protein
MLTSFDNRIKTLQPQLKSGCKCLKRLIETTPDQRGAVAVDHHVLSMSSVLDDKTKVIISRMQLVMSVCLSVRGLSLHDAITHAGGFLLALRLPVSTS